MSTSAFQADDYIAEDATLTMTDLEAATSQMAQLVCPAASTEQLVRALWGASYATLFMAVNAGFHQPAGLHKVAYYIILAVVFAAVPVEMATAFWLPRSGPRFRIFAQGLQRVAVVLLVVVSAVSGFELTLKV